MSTEAILALIASRSAISKTWFAEVAAPMMASACRA